MCRVERIRKIVDCFIKNYPSKCWKDEETLCENVEICEQLYKIWLEGFRYGREEDA